MQPDTRRPPVTYGHYRGTAAADKTDFRWLHRFAEKHGIDAGKYFITGAQTYRGEVHHPATVHTSGFLSSPWT